MKFKEGDLIIETIENHFLILLTEVEGNKGIGYMVDKAYPDSEEYEDYHEEDGIDKPDLIESEDDGEDIRIRLNKCIFVASVI